jgi:hypothetical protein
MPSDDVDYLQGRTTHRVGVYSDSVVFEFTDGSLAEVVELDGGLRLLFRRPPVEGSTVAPTSVVVGEGPNPRLG